MVVAVAKGIGSLLKKDVKGINLRGLNQNSPIYKEQINFIENYISKNKLKTNEDVLNLMQALRTPKEDKRMFYSGRNMFDRARKLIQYTNLDDATKKTNIDVINKTAENRRTSAGSMPQVKEGKEKFLFNKYVAELDKMKPYLDEGIVGAYKAVRGEGSKGTEHAFRNASWLFHKNKIKKERPDLYKAFNPIMNQPRPKKNTRQKKLRTGDILLAKDDFKDYKYMQETARKNNPKFYDTLSRFRDRENTGLRNIYDELQMTQLHPAGMSVGTGSISKVKNIGSKYEMIPPDLVDKIRYPQYMGTPRMNRIQSDIEMGKGGEDGLIDHLVDRWEILGHKFTPYGKTKAGGEWTYSDPGKLTQKQINKVKELDKKIAIKEARADKHGIEIEFYNPVKKNLDTWGTKDYNVFRFIDEARKGNRKDGGLVEEYAGGGLIKKGIQKLLESTKFNQSRRKFMKQAGATAAATALPTKTLATLVPKAASKAATRFAPPWIKSMVGALDQLSGPNVMGRTLANGTMIRNFGKKGNKQEFEITNSDGYKVPVNMTKEKDGSLHIEFDIRDDFNNNQHIYMDKKTGQVEIVDENFYMTGPEDYAKDDPITWDVTTPSQMDEYAKKMGIMKGDVDDYMLDYASTPEGGDYSDLFESFVDSFSPSGSIFKTKQKAEIAKNKKIQEETYKRAQAQRRLEDEEMRFESQFRGGNIHGFNRGGSVTSRMDAGGRSPAGARALQEMGYFNKPSAIRPRPKPPMPSNNISNIQPRIKPEVGGGYDWNRMMDAIGMVETNPAYMKANNLGPRHLYKSDEGAYGTYGLLRENFEGGLPMQRDDNSSYQHGTLAGTGFGVKRWKDFKNTWKDESLQRQYATDFLKGMYNEFKARPDSKIHGQDALYEAITRYGDQKDKDYYNKVMGFYNKGGMAEKFSVDDAVAMIRANPQSFVGGGLVKKFAPKVLGKLTDFKPKIAGRVYQPPEGPYTITNDSGARVLDKDFKTVEEAQGALKELASLRTSDASTFKIFGKRPPKTAEGVSESAPEVNLGMVGKEIPPEQPGAMYWNSREKIIDSPMETMTGQQWLDYLKRPTRNFNPIKDMELNDTSLSTFLSRNAKKPMAKEQLVKDFDNTLAPQLDVTVLGSQSTKDLRSLARKLQKIDLQGYRPGPVKNTLQGLKNNLDSFNTAMEGGKVDEIQGAIKKVDDLVEKNFGLKNVMTEGFPQRFPFELKAPLQSMQQVAGTRATGFKKYKRNPVHEGTQTLGGGENYREFLFNYKQPAGSPRAIEPEYKYAHDFNLDESDRMGGFVHMRTSDRTDEFGRRLLHIEEIQSDMHQPINAAARRVKKAQADGQTNQRAYQDDLKKSKYAPRGDLVKEVDNANEQQMMLIQSKIEDLLAQPQTPQMATRIARLNRERAKVRKIIADKRAKAQEGEHSGVPQGPYAKTEDYNEFVMKYALRTAQEGGYDGISISSSAIKNRSLSPGSRDFGGNIAAYGPMAEGAMKKAAKKSGAKYLKTSIIDDTNRGWEIPMILLKDNPEAAAKIARGLPAYQRGGIAVNG